MKILKACWIYRKDGTRFKACGYCEDIRNKIVYFTEKEDTDNARYKYDVSAKVFYERLTKTLPYRVSSTSQVFSRIELTYVIE